MTWYYFNTVLAWIKHLHVCDARSRKMIEELGIKGVEESVYFPLRVHGDKIIR